MPTKHYKKNRYLSKIKKSNKNKANANLISGSGRKMKSNVTIMRGGKRVPGNLYALGIDDNVYNNTAQDDANNESSVYKATRGANPGAYSVNKVEPNFGCIIRFISRAVNIAGGNTDAVFGGGALGAPADLRTAAGTTAALTLLNARVAPPARGGGGGAHIDTGPNSASAALVIGDWGVDIDNLNAMGLAGGPAGAPANWGDANAANAANSDIIGFTFTILAPGAPGAPPGAPPATMKNIGGYNALPRKIFGQLFGF